ncbi:hypothetical protein EV702DRAFT_1211121 [Suillus placidus]|uniref:Uncharacterized protein n=1 Tax=Suillus placidus TaxID=48579 RepID=A0A9P7D559_9AGAM|nr:hypothetical protein EV702DRAFT_1211121 [Suillus placidus]
MHIHITEPDENRLSRAKVLTEDLLEVVRSEHAKAMMQQQMELHQAQMQFAQYPIIGGYGAPPPAPENAPLPLPFPPPDGSAPPPYPGAPTGAPGPEGQDAYAAYWQYFFEYSLSFFKERAASQQAQYYQTYTGQTASPAPSDSAPPPPPPPPPA